MASTLTLPTFFTDWVANGVREWMDANKVPCIPFVCAEVEVERVCAYYYVPTEISRYIQRLAFSNHLPNNFIPQTIYTLVSPKYWHNKTQLRKIRILYEPDGTVGEEDTVYCELGRDHSIMRSAQMGSDPRNIPKGKFRNEANRHYDTLVGTQECKARIFNGRAHLDENGRGYENMYRKFKGIKNAHVWIG